MDRPDCGVDSVRLSPSLVQPLPELAILSACDDSRRLLRAGLPPGPKHSRFDGHARVSSNNVENFFFLNCSGVSQGASSPLDSPQFLPPYIKGTVRLAEQPSAFGRFSSR